MKLTVADTSSSIAELINDEDVMELIESRREANEPIEVEIAVGSGDSIFIETIDDEASATDSFEVTSTFRFKTFDLNKVYVIASASTDFFITLVG